jgi:hypothetical protein
MTPTRAARSKRSIWLATACAATVIGAAAPALADIHWLVSGTFDDGATLSGWFNINPYGYLDGFNLVTTSGTKEAGFDYTAADSYAANGGLYVDAEPGYKNDLHIDFADVLTTAVADDPIVGGAHGPSYECVNSWSCYVATGGVTRYLVSGYASVGGTNPVGDLTTNDRLPAVPEPAAWVLMIAGFGLAGVALRRRRTLATAG